MEDDDVEELYGKRKKRRVKCPNPLFVKWLTEWRDEAAEKGWKSQYNYGKALAALKKFPLPLASGKECKMLKNFGEKTCKMLDDKLAEHMALNGSTSDERVSPIGSSSLMTTANEKASTSSSSTGSTSPVMTVNQKASSSLLTSETSSIGSSSHVTTTNEKASSSLLTTVEDESSESETENNTRQQSRKRGKPSDCRDYIPTVGSGSYAILLALYRDRESPGCHGYLSKQDLIQLAQPLAEKSFTQPDPNQRYTAWSSMSTLIKKGLVIKERSPAQYSLTEEGCTLAHRLQYVSQNQPITSLEPTSHDTQPLPSINISQSDDRIDSVGVGEPVDENGLRFWYITEDNKQVLRKDQAAVTVNDDIGVGFLIKVNYTKLIISGKKYSLDLTRPLGEVVYVYLADDDAEETACPEEDPTITNHRDAASQEKNSDLSKSKTDATKTKHESQSSSLTSSLTTEDSRIKTKSKLLSSSPMRSSTARDSTIKTKSLSQSSSLTSSSASRTMPNVPETVSDIGSNSKTPYMDMDSNSQSSVTSTISSACSDMPVPEYVLKPGQFEVVLCIDNREFYGSSKSNSKTLLPDLIRNNVSCDLRELHVGDLVWIAREKTSSSSGERRELVLDYIVERKRMDDLVSSMVDGRLLDQKFRLKRCGVRNAIFLIEDYGSMQNFNIGEDRIRQSIANTQVVDGFTVKRVKDTKASVLYLTVMTRYLQSYYQDKTLHACSPDVVKEMDVKFDIKNREHYLMPFINFNLSSVKSKALKVKEMFGKQLIQLHGMSADKAKAVIDIYPTPTHLMEAYNQCLTTKDKEAMLSSIKCGKLGRNLGIGQSRQIATLYNSKVALT